MAGIKLANGREVKELRVWDGVKWVAKRGRIFNGEKWIDFIRPPLNFKDDFIIPIGLTRQTAKTLVREPVSVGQRTLLVQNATGFNVGDEITITDGVNSENVNVAGRNLVLNSSNGFVDNWGSWDRTTVSNVDSNVNGIDTKVIQVGARTNRDNSYDNAIHRAIKEFEVDQYYTLSCLARMSSNSISDVGYVYLYINRYEKKVISKEWTLIHTTNKVTSTSNTIHIWVDFDEPSDDIYEIAFIKLEKGSIPTPWTPAPEDIYGTSDNVLSITPTKNSYKGNSIVARTNAVIENSKLVHSVHKTYSVK